MSCSINALAVDYGDDVFYLPAFRRMVESHLPYLLLAPDNMTLPVEPHSAVKYESDWHGLLLSMQIPMYLHFIVMRMNGLLAPTENTSQLSEIMIPAPGRIDSLVASYKAQTNKIL